MVKAPTRGGEGFLVICSKSKRLRPSLKESDMTKVDCNSSRRVDLNLTWMQEFYRVDSFNKLSSMLKLVFIIS